MSPAIPKKKSEAEVVEEVAQTVLRNYVLENPLELDMMERFLLRMRDEPEFLVNLTRYKRPPVSVQEFVESPNFLNKKGVLWPKVLDHLVAMCDGTRTEVVLTGAIGVAKTTLATYAQAYQLYIMSCLRSPHEEFGLDPASEIIIVFQSINRDLAKILDYARFKALIDGSPYFKNVFPYDRQVESELRFPHRITIKPVAGHDQAAIGQNVIGGVIDEINFMSVVENSTKSMDGAVHDQAIKNYNSIASRRESRFMRRGWLPGLLCLVSSRNYPGQFTDKKEAEAVTNPRIYVYDEVLWNILPKEEYKARFSGEMMRVFVGDHTRRPRIITDEEEVDPTDKDLVILVPIEYADSFRRDIGLALRDIAGRSTLTKSPFILDREKIARAFGKVDPVMLTDTVDFVTLKPRFKPKLFRRLSEPRFVHLDTSLTGDSMGIACGYVDRFVSIVRGIDGLVETLPVINFDFVLEIVPPRNGEIMYYKVRELLYALVQHKLPIKWISCDTFQSADMLQILKQKGFVTGIQSVDKDLRPYMWTKTAILDERILLPNHQKAQIELTTLELMVKEKKVDHPAHGSKDVADAIAGVVYGLTQRREVWVRHKVNNLIPASVAIKEAA